MKRAGLELNSPNSCSLEPSIGSQRIFQTEKSVDKGLEVEKYVLCLGNHAGTARKEPGNRGRLAKAGSQRAFGT